MKKEMYCILGMVIGSAAAGAALWFFTRYDILVVVLGALIMACLGGGFGWAVGEQQEVEEKRRRRKPKDNYIYDVRGDRGMIWIEPELNEAVTKRQPEEYVFIKKQDIEIWESMAKGGKIPGLENMTQGEVIMFVLKTLGVA